MISIKLTAILMLVCGLAFEAQAAVPPQICAIAFEIELPIIGSNSSKSVHFGGACLGALVALRNESTFGLLTAAHCTPDEIRKERLRDLQFKQDDIKKELWNRIAIEGMWRYKVNCGSTGNEYADSGFLEPKDAEIYPTFSRDMGVAEILAKTLRIPWPFPYPIDVGIIRLKAINGAISPLPITSKTPANIFANQPDCWAMYRDVKGGIASARTKVRNYSQMFAIEQQFFPGDSGGPLICSDGSGNVEVVGVNSFIEPKNADGNSWITVVQPFPPSALNWLRSKVRF